MLYRRTRWHHYVHFRLDDLSAELEGVERARLRPQPLDLISRAEKQCLAGTHRGAHRLFAHRGAVVTHVALHHQVHGGVHLRHTEGAGEHAVVTSDAARLTGGLHDPVFHTFDRIGRADLRAGGRFAMHAYHRHGLRRVGLIDVIQLDHRIALVRVAFGTCLHTPVATDAATRIDEKFIGFGDRHEGSSRYASG